MPSRLVALVAIIGVLALLALVFPVPADGQGVANDDTDLIGQLTGEDMELAGGAPESDPEGDGATRAGEPADLPPGTDVTETDWYEVEGTVDADTLNDICENGTEVNGEPITAVCPDDRSALETAARWLYVRAQTGDTIAPEQISQFVFLWAEAGLPTYQANEFDPNFNETDSVDGFRPAPGSPLLLGRTSFRNGQFVFDAAFAGAMLLYGNASIAFLIPVDSVGGQCLNAAIAVIAGNAIDKAPLPPEPTGAIQVAGTAAATTTTTTTVPTTTTTPPVTDPPDDDTDSQEGETTGSETEAPAEEGGSGALLLALIVGGAVLLGLLFYFLLFRKSDDCEEERLAADAAYAAWKRAVDAKAAAERAWVEAAGEAERTRMDAFYYDVMRPRRGEYPQGSEGDAAFEADQAEHEAEYGPGMQDQEQAEAAAQSARQSVDETIAAESEAHEAHTAAWKTYQDCLSELLDEPHQPEMPPPPPTSPGGRPPDSEAPDTASEAEVESTSEPGPITTDRASGTAVIDEGSDSTGTAPGVTTGPDGGCPKGKTRLVDYVTAPREVFTVPAGDLTIEVDGLDDGWQASISPHMTLDAFLSLRRGEVVGAFSALRGQPRNMTLKVIFPTKKLKIVCKAVELCDGMNWNLTGEKRAAPPEELPGEPITWTRTDLVGVDDVARWFGSAQRQAAALRKTEEEASVFRVSGCD